MKKRFISLLIIGCMLTMLCACGEQTISTSKEKTSDNKSEEEVVLEEETDESDEMVRAKKTDTDSLSESKKEDKKTDVKGAYEAFLDGKEEAVIFGKKQTIPKDWDLSGEGLTYAIVDLNDDGVEELIIKEMVTHVFMYKDGVVTDTNYVSFTSGARVDFFKGGYVMTIDTTHAGRNEYSVSKMDADGYYNEEASLLHIYPDPNYSMDEEYQLTSGGDGIDISKDEFKDGLMELYKDEIIPEWQIWGLEDEMLTTSVNKARNGYLEDKIYSYYVDPDYNGDMGKVIDEYKDIVLTYDDDDCHIERVVDDENYEVSYKMYSGKELLFETSKIENFPNSLEIFSFKDMDHDGRNEVMMTSYTETTMGWLVGYCFIYESQEDGTWKETVLVDFNKTLLKSVNTALTKEMKNHDVDMWNYRDIVMKDYCIEFLVDYGYKDGAAQTVDCTGARFYYGDDDRETYVAKQIMEHNWIFDF